MQDFFSDYAGFLGKLCGIARYFTSAKIEKKNWLLTERAVCTEKSRPEALAVWTEPLRRDNVCYSREKSRYILWNTERGFLCREMSTLTV